MNADPIQQLQHAVATDQLIPALEAMEALRAPRMDALFERAWAGAAGSERDVQHLLARDGATGGLRSGRVDSLLQQVLALDSENSSRADQLVAVHRIQAGLAATQQAAAVKPAGERKQAPPVDVILDTLLDGNSAVISYYQLEDRLIIAAKTRDDELIVTAPYATEALEQEMQALRHWLEASDFTPDAAAESRQRNIAVVARKLLQQAPVLMAAFSRPVRSLY